MDAIVRAKQVGGSILVTVPKQIVDEERIQAGELIRIDVERLKKDWFGSLRKLKPFRREEELDTE
ncbi:hypothetical protein HYS54_00825 [Candidatus Micrarchaeota archaeon]|nr:hypothetical protein [Candidatus Micrarchaeota archaeon]